MYNIFGVCSWCCCCCCSCWLTYILLYTHSLIQASRHTTIYLETFLSLKLVNSSSSSSSSMRLAAARITSCCVVHRHHLQLAEHTQMCPLNSLQQEKIAVVFFYEKNALSVCVTFMWHIFYDDVLFFTNTDQWTIDRRTEHSPEQLWSAELSWAVRCEVCTESELYIEAAIIVIYSSHVCVSLVCGIVSLGFVVTIESVCRVCGLW